MVSERFADYNGDSPRESPLPEISETQLPGVLIITPSRHGDARGWFSETYSVHALAKTGFTRSFVQDNHAMSGQRGVLRGLHFQAPPRAQDKLVRVARGAIIDIVVDIRRGSPTFGQSITEELSEENGRQLLAPRGIAHGYLTLTDRTDVLYKVTSGYAPGMEGGLLWRDPALALRWPIPQEDVVVNARDESWPTLDQLESPFTWEHPA